MIRLAGFTIVCCVLSLGYVLGSTVGENNYLLSVLPFAFLLVTVLFYRVFEESTNSIVFKLFVLQACARYCFLPVLISAGQDYKTGTDSYYTNFAILVMVLELLAAYIIFTIYFKKQKTCFLNRNTNISSLNNKFVLVVILMLMFVYLQATQSLTKVNMVWTLKEYLVNYASVDSGNSGLGVILFTPFKVLVALLFVSIIFESRSIRFYKKKWLYLLVIISSSMFIVGTSRFSIILFAFPLLILISCLVDISDYRKLLYATGLTMLSVLIVVSLAKFSRYNTDFSVASIFTASSFNSYFAGPGNIAVGFEAFEKIRAHEYILYLVNDTLQNIPILSKLTLNEYKLTAAFNEEIYQHRMYADQIVPLSVSGLFHFGILGVVFYVPLFISISLYFERLSYKSRFIGYKYLFIYLSMTLSLVFMLNIGSFYATLVRSFFLLFLPLFMVKTLSRIKLYRI